MDLAAKWLWDRIFILDFAYIHESFILTLGFSPGTKKYLRRHPVAS
jgi:hypothetical protein